ncbi:MAG: hypothetical protein A3B96_02125 [Candidatus Spechtbacteria bacterium RIFCSPHIGHO2_02_FULL_43_15b]|uniref:Amidohydrolase 3 domain-containing protein n=1 Tax=Candidatus Spechtbacteria bacterium RIFCSPHIGHO2_01_FULL_43_30 TaxID=1802158 RepID=A0A1G2H417_9BACT|nr:MAG: hypothetical protein A2827_02075 [Candidatus Spechtbacteria bacterium RIFCSPHIGHO2_01_FULL_43_30]OGZ58848.1 MAG: hypothetical protein A3B96_02125 [Candidatus Spechtbacteria bacterium RIFCSPHIGHO2_02_FULL_43_15b]
MLIKGGTIIDGTGKNKFIGDVRFDGELIKEIGESLKPQRGENVLDATGKFVTPGFIDIANRSDTFFSIILRPSLSSLVKQGVTTIIGGICGASLAPLASKEAILAIQKWQNISGLNINWVTTGEFLAEIESRDIAINFGTMTGHGTLRRGLVGDSFGPLSPEEMKKMEYLLERSISEGSFGMSTGLAYSHEKVALFNELVVLAKLLKNKNCFYATHLRDEGENLLVSVNEVISLSREAELPCHVYHFKSAGKNFWGQFKNALEMIDSANSSGADINFDVYPYSSTATVLYLLLPDWVSSDGKAKVLMRLKNKYIRERIVEEMKGKEDSIKDIIIAKGGVSNINTGRSISEVARASECSVTDALLNILIASNDRIIGFIPSIDDINVENAISNKHSIIASDGAGYSMKDGKSGMLVHPRSFGAFTKFLGDFVRNKQLLSWEEGIRKITSFPAEKIGLAKRGQLKKGYFADIIIFDPEKISDRATFRDPFKYSEGVDYVFVNGGLALRNGKFQKKRHGKVLRKA